MYRDLIDPSIRLVSRCRHLDCKDLT